jgi:hypothetical protein
MELPIRVRGRMSVSRFIFFVVLDTILSLAIAFGPSVGLFYFLKPEAFFERLIAVVLCGGLFCVMGFAAFFFWAYFISETTGW